MTARFYGRFPTRVHPGKDCDETTHEERPESTGNKKSLLLPLFVRRLRRGRIFSSSNSSTDSSDESITSVKTTQTQELLYGREDDLSNTNNPTRPQSKNQGKNGIIFRKSISMDENTIKRSKLKVKPSRGTARLKVVLDMDECIIHSVFTDSSAAGHVSYGRPPNTPSTTSRPNPVETFPLRLLDNSSCIVNKRPHVDWFLEQVAIRFDCYVMTAGTREYAEPLLDALDPYGLLKGRFYRDDCIFHEGHFLKDLTLVAEDPKRVVLVDNNPASFVLCPANGIPVPSFYDDPRDRALQHTLDVLLKLEDAKDVRRPLRQMYGLESKLAPMVQHFHSAGLRHL